MNPVYELREAAERIRETPRCTSVHADGCECPFWDEAAVWLDRTADDLALALDTARRVLTATESLPKPGVDFLPDDMDYEEQAERAAMMFGSHPALKAGA